MKSRIFGISRRGIRKIIVCALYLIFRSMPRQATTFSPTNVKRILVIDLDNLGDVLLATPAIRALKEKFAQADIAMIACHYNLDTVKENPNITETIIINRPTIGDKVNLFRIFNGNVRLILKLWRRHFDIGVVFEANERFASFGNALLSLAGIKYRVGRDFGDYADLLTRCSSMAEIKHRIEMYLDVARLIGADTSNGQPEMHVTSEDKNFAHKFLLEHQISEKDIVVGIHPGATTYVNLRRWHPKGFAEVGEQICIRHGAKVFITGSPEDIELDNQIERMMNPKPIIAAGRTTVGQLAALLRKMDLFITNDTGALHIADAVGVSHIIAIFGPSNPQQAAPRNSRCSVVTSKLPCSPCEILREGDRAMPCANPKGEECLDSISVEQVLDAVEQRLCHVIAVKRGL